MCTQWQLFLGALYLEKKIACIEHDLMSREQVEGLFCEGATPILELSEIRQWCRTKQLDDDNLQVS